MHFHKAYLCLFDDKQVGEKIKKKNVCNSLLHIYFEVHNRLIKFAFAVSTYSLYLTKVLTFKTKKTSLGIDHSVFDTNRFTPQLNIFY